MYACSSLCIVCRISDLFDHNELDAIKDRKDKFKRYLTLSFFLTSSYISHIISLILFEQ